MPEEIAYDDFTLVSPLGGLFRYYTSDGKYYREALDERARLTQFARVKIISKSVHEFAYRKACGTDGVPQ